MDNQSGSIVPSTGNMFGVSQAAVINDDTADLMFGSSNITSDPSKLTPITKKDPKKKNIISLIPEDNNDEDNALPTSTDFTADDLLNSLGSKNTEDEDDETVETKIQPIVASEEQDAEDNQNDTDSTFGSLAKDLLKLGIFTERDEDSTTPITTPEAFKERWIKEKQEQANKDVYDFLMSKHGDEGVEAFDAIFVKGVSPKEYLAKFDAVQTMENLDLSSEDNQKRVYRELYRKQGLSEDKIEKKLQKAIDYGDLEEEATIAHEILLKQERENMEDELDQAAQEAQLKIKQSNEYKNNLNVILSEKLKQKEFDGIPLTDKVARETYDFLTTEKWQLPSGDRLTDFDKYILELKDPKNHEIKVKLGLLLKNNLDLTKIKMKQLSEKNNTLFNNLARKEETVKRTNKLAVPTKDFFSGM